MLSLRPLMLWTELAMALGMVPHLVRSTLLKMHAMAQVMASVLALWLETREMVLEMVLVWLLWQAMRMKVQAMV